MTVSLAKPALPVRANWTVAELRERFGPATAKVSLAKPAKR